MSRRAQAKCRIILSILSIHVECLPAAIFGVHMDAQDQQDQQDQQRATVPHQFDCSSALGVCG
ncbi:MAG: hypothetical protein SGJ09_07530 [Phycisphaerae bacterium]|nr:hypothetical protein [Phycisphaerae bacterium]